MFDLRRKVAERFELEENELELSMGMSGDYEEAVMLINVQLMFDS